MVNKQAIEWIIWAGDDIPHVALKHALAQVLHKLRYPMEDILAKVPGDTLSARAQMIGVSRQTMYVWSREATRPNEEQAQTISKLTGIPSAHIRADGYKEGIDDARTTAEKTTARVAKDGGGVSPRAKRTRSKRGRVAPEQGRSRHDRTPRKRSRRRSGHSVNV